jgi:hypothetical protein
MMLARIVRTALLALLATDSALLLGRFAADRRLNAALSPFSSPAEKVGLPSGFMVGGGPYRPAEDLPLRDN